MQSTPLPPSALQDFLLDAQVSLSQAQECLQHLQMIDNDPDACLCLDDTLGSLAVRAETLGLEQVAEYTSALRDLLAPACGDQHLQTAALPSVQACLDLLAWQLELLDAHTGRLDLDPSEQHLLLVQLASALDQPHAQTCASGKAKHPARHSADPEK
ncbi:putative CheA signal transduction histidine kinase [Pseudomonas reidholzensis]|uniref:Putative CheA signal transduction histidine kinase n=1 Tax=Pseudomonas reidholzensis TaxID=1785162 RepID=A0A383S1E6_9PSED|nr:histidine kinase [Pseudomonas reidholzensis]SYX92704.1 putative CheA signal transduction histidine kinase [Pseudomonas reidholzensis]